MFDLLTNPTQENQHRLRIFYLASFMACFIAAAITTQIYSGIHPTMDHSPLDFFTGGALWMVSALCLVKAARATRNIVHSLFWLAGCAALSMLAIDEFIGLHEATESVVGDDDHIKVVMWACTPVALALIVKVAKAPREIAMFFVLGFAIHTGYLAVDVGDGDYFTLPLPLETLQWTEDIFELLFVSSYLFTFLLMAGNPSEHVVPRERVQRAVQRADADPAWVAPVFGQR